MRLHACVRDFTFAGHICQAVCEGVRDFLMTGIQIRTLIARDWERVSSIYLDGIATGQATFETRAPSWVEWDSAHLPAPRLVAISGEDISTPAVLPRRGPRIVGWAALTPVSKRSVYAGVAEVSVYVSSDWRGRGVGKRLLEGLVIESEQKMIWTLQASIFSENFASITLHKSCGFREVGRRERIGNMNGVWRDTILLERRSNLVGK
jgi:L-amino acid N-acyltransferase YncA